VVIFFSLAFAFSTWARTVIAVGGRVLYAYVTHWMGIHNIPIWTFHGTSTLKEFEKEIVIELRRKAFLKRIREINAAVNEPPLGDQDRRSSWGTVINGTRGFRNRRTTTLDSEAA
jgi:hypothetical protein